MMNIYVYIHVCCINHWQDTFTSLMHKMRDSGLYDKISEIRCGVLGNYDEASIFNDPKIVIVNQSQNLELYDKNNSGHPHK